MNQDHKNVFRADVRNVIIGVLAKHGYRNGEIEDAVLDVQVRALEGLERRKSPTTIRNWQAYCANIAADYAVSQHRKDLVRDKYDAGLCETPDEHAPFAPSGEARDPVDAKRQLAVLLEMFDKGEMPEHGREILQGVADGEKLPVIARELGIPAKEAKSRLRKMRRLYFKRLGLLGLLVMMMVGILLGGGVGGVATRDGNGVRTPPGPSAAETAATALAEAPRALDAGKSDAPNAEEQEMELQAKPR